VASTAGSLPEVLGDAAMLVDPGDIAGLADAIARLLDDDSERAARVEAGKQQVDRYSWPDAAQRFADLYRSVAA
jgi:glycosyltransferase involved in cell wall biosynthesis